MLDQITPIILTYNEEANIHRTLSALTWAHNIVVIDSFSNDKTVSICNQFTNVTLIKRAFDQHSLQWNFALAQDIKTEWVLALDADHVLSENLISELTTLTPHLKIQGYWVNFTYMINGTPLKQSLYPPVISLYRRNSGHYIQDGHTQRVKIIGDINTLKSNILHDDRKPTKRWLNSQWKYAMQEAIKLKHTSWGKLSFADKMRKLGLAPIIVVPYILLVKGLIFSRWPGIIYSWQRFIAELYLQVARFKY